jgi:photosystem II stability/assembly factor-like uncharacterized protein
LLVRLAVSLIALLAAAPDFPRTAPLESRRWSTSGPLDGPVISLASDPNQSGVIYAGTAASVFGLGYASLWKSPDLGTTWVRLGSAQFQITAIGVDPLAGARLFAAVRRDLGVSHTSEVFRSEDGGTTWMQLDAIPVFFVSAFAFDPAQRDTLFAAGDGGIAKTTDGGDTWEIVYAWNPGPTSFAADPSRPQRIFAGGAGVVRSDDGGRTWQPLPIAPPYPSPLAVYVLSLAVSPSEPEIIYAATDQGAFRSADGGDTWAMASMGLPTGRVDSIAVEPQDSAMLFATTSAGVSESHDGGQHWLSSNSGLTASGAGPLALDRSGRFLFVGMDEGVFVRRLRRTLVTPFR